MKAFGFRPKLYTALKNYSKELFMADLMAGIIVGIVALPLAIAFGIASGVSPEKGIITAIIAGFIISLMGGSKVQIGGPTGAFIVIIYGIIQQYGESGLIVATLMAGVLLILLGVFKLGAVIKFIPYPIIVGFTSGIAVTIFTTQIADIFGLTFGGEKVPGDFVGKWMIYFRHFDTVNWWNTIVSIVSIFIIAITPRFSKKIPGSLIAIIVVTVAVWLMKVYGGIDCIDTIGDLDVEVFKGIDQIFEEMEGLRFKVGPISFYQTNSEQAYNLYKVAREFAGLTGNELVYDLYTGTGAIANFVARQAR